MQIEEPVEQTDQIWIRFCCGVSGMINDDSLGESFWENQGVDLYPLLFCFARRSRGYLLYVRRVPARASGMHKASI